MTAWIHASLWGYAFVHSAIWVICKGVEPRELLEMISKLKGKGGIETIAVGSDKTVNETLLSSLIKQEDKDGEGKDGDEDGKGKDNDKEGEGEDGDDVQGSRSVAV